MSITHRRLSSFAARDAAREPDKQYEPPTDAELEALIEAYHSLERLKVTSEEELTALLRTWPDAAPTAKGPWFC